MQKLFDIITLKDRQTFKSNSNTMRLGDPVAIILGGTQVIGQLLPNIFGSQRATPDDFLKLFPGNGFWTVKFRNYLQGAIKYTKDIPRDLLMYTTQFVIDNNNGICPQTYTFQNPPGTNPGGDAGGGWNPCLTKFYAILKQEQMTGGSQPVGTFPSMTGINWSELIPYAVGGVALLLILSNRKKRK